MAQDGIGSGAGQDALGTECSAPMQRHIHLQLAAAPAVGSRPFGGSITKLAGFTSRWMNPAACTCGRGGGAGGAGHSGRAGLARTKPTSRGSTAQLNAAQQTPAAARQCCPAKSCTAAQNRRVCAAPAAPTCSSALSMLQPMICSDSLQSARELWEERPLADHAWHPRRPGATATLGALPTHAPLAWHGFGLPRTASALLLQL